MACIPNKTMKFPLWRYLNQSLFDADCPPILNPQWYWRNYCAWHLEGCLKNNWVEQCWNLDYYEFSEHFRSFIGRHYLEENSIVLMEHCWQLKPLSDSWRCHPAELILDV